METQYFLLPNLVVWRNSVWLFGAISFGYLAQFHLVIWRNFVWSFQQSTKHTYALLCESIRQGEFRITLDIIHVA
jgi:hypothetical protein